MDESLEPSTEPGNPPLATEEALAVQTPTPGAAHAEGSFRKAAVRGAVWIGVGFGIMYVVRFVSGPILTRLVAPEIYGLLDIAMVFIQGLHMFADIGIGVGVIQSKRGDEREFLNTAWTLQVLRGLALWVASGLIGWAVAVFYEQPILLLVIPAIGTTALLEGLNSTALFVFQRHLARGRLVALEVTVQTIGLAVTIVWVTCIGPSIWAFVVGTLISCLLYLILTHVALPGAPSRFRWEREAARELLHFGKWVLVSTMITFLALQAERLIVAKVGGPSLMGVYGRALALAGIATGLMSSFATQLILPLYSRMHHAGRDIRDTFGRVHGSATLFAALLVSGMLATGPAAVKSLYGDSYEDAGWMLQFVAVGAWFQMLEGTIGASLLTLGKPRALATGNGSRLVAVLIFVPAGYFLGQWAGWGGYLDGGFLGMLLGFIAADIARYFVVIWIARQNGMSAVPSDAKLSVLIVLISLVAILAGHFLAGLLDDGIPRAKVRALVIFLSQGTLIVVTWGLVYLLWFRRKLRLLAGR
jgi:O-antigen/teichoic acid export membrane protein